MNGGGDGPANDNVEAPEAANDNVAPNAAEGGGGGEGPNEGGSNDGAVEPVEGLNEGADDNVAPGEPTKANDTTKSGDEVEGRDETDATDDGDGAEAGDSNEASERVIAWLHGLTFAINLMVSAAGYEVQNRIDQVKENLYEMSVEVSIPQPGDSPTARALSQKEQAFMAQMEDLVKQAKELERAEKDAAPEPPGSRQAPELEPAEQNRGSRRRSDQAANDNDSGGGGAPNE